jgi:hypothetical protein
MKQVLTLGLSGLALACLTGIASAQLIDIRTDSDPLNSNFVKDGVIPANEYGPGNSQFFLGAGQGFGGTLGDGELYMDFDANNLYVAFQFNNNLNDDVVMFFDTKAGGFTDATMSDTSDGGRSLISNLTRDSNDVLPFEADYALLIGSFGAVTFELTSGTHNFLAFDGTFTGNSPIATREVAIPKSAFSIGSSFDFFVAYGSESNFMSNEGMPGQSFSTSDNPGFGSAETEVVWSRYNRFQAVPGPSALAVFAMGGLPVVGALLRRRRK